jgi:hypothetical protein
MAEYHRPGEGDIRCGRPRARDGMPCRNWQVEGLDACVQHVDDELLDEAEEITGVRRCRRGFGQPGACTWIAVAGTEPPRCKVHGANAGGVIAKQAAGRIVEGRITDRTAEIVSEKIGDLMSPPPIGNPLSELLELAAEAKVWKNTMLPIVAYLTDSQRLRSAHSKVGEQLRAEIVIYERAIDRLAHILIQIAKLGIERRLAQVEHEQAQLIQRGLDAAITRATKGLPDALERQEAARQVLHRELARQAEV